jgi:hypothetical protein
MGVWHGAVNQLGGLPRPEHSLGYGSAVQDVQVVQVDFLTVRLPFVWLLDRSRWTPWTFYRDTPLTPPSPPCWVRNPAL